MSERDARWIVKEQFVQFIELEGNRNERNRPTTLVEAGAETESENQTNQCVKVHKVQLYKSYLMANFFLFTLELRSKDSVVILC